MKNTPKYIDGKRMASVKPPIMVEEHYRCSTIAGLFGCSTDYVEREIHRHVKTQMKEGLGPAFLIAGARVVPASAVLAWRERARVAM